MVESEPGMRIRRGLRSAVQPIGIADPVSTVHIDPAPLMGILIFIHMLIGNAEDVQAKPGRSRASGTGRGSKNEIAVWIVVMRG